MNPPVVSPTTPEPSAGQPEAKRICPSQTLAYRAAYRAARDKRERANGGFKAHGYLLDRIAIRSQAEVARILGVSREAVRQTENRALSKLRLALLGLYRELSH
jgi:hypothetical protein